MAKRRVRTSTPKKDSLHSYVFPHKGNDYKPHIFSTKGVAIVLLFLALVEGAVIFDTKVIQRNGEFTASVLPAVLAGLTNNDRTANGLTTLTLDSDLAAAAQLKANDMAANGYFAHVSPTGKTPWYWLGKVGYQYTYAGENLAVNFDDSKAVEDAWMASPTHHANIVKPQYTRVGYGIASGIYEGKQTTFVVQLLATPPEGDTAAPASVPAVLAKSTPTNPAVKAPVTNLAPIEEKVTSTEAEAAVPATVPLETENRVAINTPTEVLGAQNTVVKAPNVLEQIAASPSHTSVYVLGTLSTVFLFLLLIALYIHVRIKYVEVLGGGALIFAVALALLIINITISQVQVPVDTQSASVVQAL